MAYCTEQAECDMEEVIDPVEITVGVSNDLDPVTELYWSDVRQTVQWQKDWKSLDVVDVQALASDGKVSWDPRLYTLPWTGAAAELPSLEECLEYYETDAGTCQRKYLEGVARGSYYIVENGLRDSWDEYPEEQATKFRNDLLKRLFVEAFAMEEFPTDLAQQLLEPSEQQTSKPDKQESEVAEALFAPLGCEMEGYHEDEEQDEDTEFVEIDGREAPDYFKSKRRRVRSRGRVRGNVQIPWKTPVAAEKRVPKDVAGDADFEEIDGRKVRPVPTSSSAPGKTLSWRSGKTAIVPTTASAKPSVTLRKPAVFFSGKTSSFLPRPSAVTQTTITKPALTAKPAYASKATSNVDDKDAVPWRSRPSSVGSRRHPASAPKTASIQAKPSVASSVMQRTVKTVSEVRSEMVPRDRARSRSRRRRGKRSGRRGHASAASDSLPPWRR